MILLGIDGGQTSTKAGLYDTAKGSLLLDSGPPIDHLLTPTGQEAGKKGIQRALAALLARAGGVAKIDAAVLSISGVLKEHEGLLRQWVNECVEAPFIEVVPDAVANLTGASNGANDGVLVIAGGGSIAYYAHQAKEYTAGGYGHILGDEGSAYWTGLEAIKAAVRAHERRGPQTDCSRIVLEHFQAASYWDIKRRLHADQIHRGDIAKLALLLNEAAGRGDEISRRILQTAGTELGGLAVSVIGQLKEAGIASVRRVYPTGGMFQSKRWVMPSFRRAVAEAHPDYEVAAPRHSPVIGTLLLAARSQGLPPDALKNLEVGHE